MRKEHNFKVIPQSERVYFGRMVRRYHCADCDSIVQYSAALSEHDVNHLVANSNFACLPPLEVQQLADTDYYTKKYDGKDKALKN